MSSQPTNGRRTPDARLLVVEDEPNILELLSASLRYSGFEVITAAAGGEAVQAAQRHRPDLIVLDVMLPDMDGFDVIRRLRGGGARIPVVFLTARDSTEDKIRGLTLGGDDYVTKPFSLEEVIARIRAVLRRTRGDGSEPPPRLKFADLELDEDSHEVWRGGQADPAVPHRVQAAALLHGQRQPGAVQDADPRPRLGLRLPRATPASWSRTCRCCAARSTPPSRTCCTRCAASATSCGSPRPRHRGSDDDGPGGTARVLAVAAAAAGPDAAAGQADHRRAALVAIALAVISIAGIAVLRSYLLGQADNQLQRVPSASHPRADAVGTATCRRRSRIHGSAGVVVDWIPQGGSMHRSRPAGATAPAELRPARVGLAARPAVPASSRRGPGPASAEPLTVARLDIGRRPVPRAGLSGSVPRAPPA